MKGLGPRLGVHLRFDAETLQIGDVEEERPAKIGFQGVRRRLPRHRNPALKVIDRNRDLLDRPAGGVDEHLDRSCRHCEHGRARQRQPQRQQDDWSAYRGTWVREGRLGYPLLLRMQRVMGPLLQWLTTTCHEGSRVLLPGVREAGDRHKRLSLHLVRKRGDTLKLPQHALDRTVVRVVP